MIALVTPVSWLNPNRPFLLALVCLHLAFKTFSGWKSNFLKEEEEETRRQLEIFSFYVLSCLSVFLSHFKFVWNQDTQTDSGAEGGDHRDVPTEETPAGTGNIGSPPGSGRSSEGFSLQAGADTTSQEWVGAQLDEDGDLDVVRRPRAASDPEPAGPLRDKVHPMILTQEEDDILGDEAQESSTRDVIKIGK